MKSLNLARPQLLMIIGLPGAGKSFFAQQFSEMFDAPVVSQNRIRNELFESPTYGSQENDLVGRMAGYFTDELIKTKRSFIVDGGCNARNDRLQLSQLARKHGYEPQIIWVQTDLATCRSRALKRTADMPITEEIFEALVRRFTEPAKENHVVISGKHTYNTQAKMVLRRLVAGREAVADAAHQQANQATQRPTPGRPNGRGIVIR
jgi:predicted kinase